jgi:hypothetical protein
MDAEITARSHFKPLMIPLGDLALAQKAKKLLEDTCRHLLVFIEEADFNPVRVVVGGGNRDCGQSSECLQ